MSEWRISKRKLEGLRARLAEVDEAMAPPGERWTETDHDLMREWVQLTNEIDRQRLGLWRRERRQQQHQQ